jgi:hypothetical protein
LTAAIVDAELKEEDGKRDSEGGFVDDLALPPTFLLPAPSPSPEPLAPFLPLRAKSSSAGGASSSAKRSKSGIGRKQSCWEKEAATSTVAGAGRERIVSTKKSRSDSTVLYLYFEF